jgi:hypothetical protein
MLLKKRFTLFSVAAVFGLLNAATLLPAQAQAQAQAQAAPPANPFQNFNVPPSLFFGFLGQGGGITDPTHSSAMQLLQRNDVRNEIFLDLKQQNAMDELRTKSQQDLQKTMMTSIQESMKALKDVPQDQQQGQIQERMDQFANTMQTFQGDLDKQTNAILRPKQVTRLHELDLRWRGPLALSDPKVAEALKLTLDQTRQVGMTVKEFMDGQQKALMLAMSPSAKPDANAQDAPANPQDRMQQMQKKIYTALHSREMEKTKTDTEAKMLELLTAAQKEQWTTMLGAKFMFRKTEVP